MKKILSRKNTIINMVLMAVILLIAYWGLTSLDSKSDELQLRTLSDAITRSCAHSYATNGAYPASLDELVENYGLQINEEKYIVHYDAFAPNIMPDIQVFNR